MANREIPTSLELDKPGAVAKTTRILLEDKSQVDPAIQAPDNYIYNQNILLRRESPWEEFHAQKPGQLSKSPRNFAHRITEGILTQRTVGHSEAPLQDIAFTIDMYGEIIVRFTKQ